MAVSAIQLDDFSPAIVYTPPLNESSLNGWSARFDGAARPQGSTGSGSSHDTQLPGASLALQFAGTAIALYGTASGEYDVLLDGTVQKTLGAEDGVLFSLTNLPTGQHSVSLKARSDVSFSKAVIPLDASPGNGLAPSNSSTWQFTGQWQPGSTSFPDGLTYTTIESIASGDSIFVQFNGATVVVAGLLSPDGGDFSATVDNVSTKSTSFANWTVHSTLFFANGLDSSKVHNLTILNEEDRTLKVAVISVAGPQPASQTSAPPMPSQPHSSDTLPQGTVIALIVGAVVAFICLLVFLFLIWRHHYRRKNQLALAQVRGKLVDASADSFVFPPAPPPSIQTYPRPPRPPAAFPRELSSYSPSPEGSSASSSPLPTMGESLRRKFSQAVSLLPAIKDKDDSVVSSSRSLGRRSYIRSLNSLRQQYLYDSRDRDDVAINTPDDPDAGFRIHDDEDKEPLEGGDFVIDADVMFSALSKSSQNRRVSAVNFQDKQPSLDAEDRRRRHASFLEFSSSSGHTQSIGHSQRTSSMIRSMTASELTQSTGDGASATIPFFSHIGRTSVPVAARMFDASAASGLEMTPVGPHARTRTGIVSFQKSLDDEPLKTPEESVPRSVSPFAGFPPRTIILNDDSLGATPGHSTPDVKRTSGQTESEAFYTAASGTQSEPHVAQGSGSSYTTRSAIPSGESSRFLPESRRPTDSRRTSQSPVPSSFEIRGHDSGSPFPPPSSPPPLPPLPFFPPLGPPPSLPHPFATATSPRLPALQVLPASPSSPRPMSPMSPLSPSGRRSESPPPWPVATRTHKERVLRKILGDDPTQSRPPLPDFDR